MAKRRMFSPTVVDTDRFLDMPPSAQCLYFHLGMRADDDGFVSSPRKITVSANCSAADLEILEKMGYIRIFESGVCGICHWLMNNQIRKDRYTETVYKEEKALMYGGLPNDIPAVNPV